MFINLNIKDFISPAIILLEVFFDFTIFSTSAQSSLFTTDISSQ